MRYLVPVAVHVMFVGGNKVLLIRRANTGFEDGNYGLIGGHLGGGETLKQAASRECEEEIGVSVSPANLEILGVERYTSPTGEGIDFYCKATAWQGEPYARAECDEVAWFDLDDLPPNMIPFMRDALQRHLSGGGWFSEIGWDSPAA